MIFSSSFLNRIVFGSLILFFLSFSIVFAQDYDIQRKEMLNKLDLTNLNNRLLLNAGVTSQNEIEYFKDLAKTKKQYQRYGCEI